jgi:hypothetical protein
LYGIGDANAGNANDLYTISTSTGAATLITQIDGAALTAIGFGPDGTLYGAGDDAAGTELLTIGSTTGAAALVGSIAPVDAFGGARSLAFVDGMLFTNGISDQLLAVNVVTGLGTLVGDSGTQSALQGLATPDGATLYSVTYAPGETSNSLYTLSTSTGVASFVLNFDGPFQPVAQVSWPDGHSSERDEVRKYLGCL